MAPNAIGMDEIPALAAAADRQPGPLQLRSHGAVGDEDPCREALDDGYFAPSVAGKRRFRVSASA